MVSKRKTMPATQVLHTVSGTSLIESIIEEEELEDEENMLPGERDLSRAEAYTNLDAKFEQEVVDDNNNNEISNYEKHQSSNAKTRKQNDAHQTLPVAQLDCDKQLQLLRDLLRIERHNNDRRRANNISLQQYIQQLQAEYLRQQNDLVEVLETSHKIKRQKQAQLDVMEQTLNEKDQLIQQLQMKVELLKDDGGLQKSFQDALEKQKETSRLEQEQLRAELEDMEQKMAQERVDNSKMLLRFEEKLEEKNKLHEQDLSKLRDRLQETQTELNRILDEPHSLIVKALREEKAKLEAQIDDLQSALETSQSKFEGLRDKIEKLVSEHEQVEQENQIEIGKLQERLNQQRRTINDLRLDLDDKQEVIHVLEFNLQRSEKRAKNLVGAMKAKETTYKEMIEQVELNSEQEIARYVNRSRDTEKRLLDCESELQSKQNDIVRLQLEHENQLESLRNDRDERLNKMSLEKQRLELELTSYQTQIAHQSNQVNERCETINYLKRELDIFKNQCQRLTNELTKSEANLKSKQYEVQAVLEAEQKRHQQALIESQQVTKNELEEAERLSTLLEASAKELRQDNERLRLKLSIAESNLSRLNSVMNKERSKIVEECERRLEDIRAQHNVFLKNKLRYKHYGHKLKKYCEHLRQVHQHLCNPTVCGHVAKVLEMTKPDTSKSKTGSHDDRILVEHPSQIKPIKMTPYQLIC